MYLSTAYIVTPFQKKSNNKKETKRIMCVFKRNSDTPLEGMVSIPIPKVITIADRAWLVCKS